MNLRHKNIFTYLLFEAFYNVFIILILLLSPPTACTITSTSVIGNPLLRLKDKGKASGTMQRFFRTTCI